MASAWITRRRTAAGDPRYRVEYRLGGRGTRIRYAGSFAMMREAQTRKGWIIGELAAMRVPDIELLAQAVPTIPTFAQAADAWRASRVDVSETTRTVHRLALQRAMPILGELRIDEITT